MSVGTDVCGHRVRDAEARAVYRRPVTGALRWKAGSQFSEACLLSYSHLVHLLNVEVPLSSSRTREIVEVEPIAKLTRSPGLTQEGHWKTGRFCGLVRLEISRFESLEVSVRSPWPLHTYLVFGTTIW